MNDLVWPKQKNQEAIYKSIFTNLYQSYPLREWVSTGRSLTILSIKLPHAFMSGAISFSQSCKHFGIPTDACTCGTLVVKSLLK